MRLRASSTPIRPLLRIASCMQQAQLSLDRKQERAAPGGQEQPAPGVEMRIAHHASCASGELPSALPVPINIKAARLTRVALASMWDRCENGCRSDFKEGAVCI